MLSLKNTGTNLPFFFFTQLASRSELHTFKVVHGGNLKTVPKPFPLNRCFRHRYFLSTRASPTAYCSLVLVRNMRPSRLSLPSPKKLPWSRVLLEKLTVTQLVKRLLVSYVNLRFITCSLESATGPYPEPHEFRPQFYRFHTYMITSHNYAGSKRTLYAVMTPLAKARNDKQNIKDSNLVAVRHTIDRSIV
jgi:hypothetical protein